MKSVLLAVVAALVAASPLPPTSTPEPLVAEGHLIAVGGGGTPDDVLAKALELAGGKRSRVVVLPQASTTEDAGKATVEMWKGAGASRVTLIDDLKRTSRARNAIAEADLIWFTGGGQLRLMEELTEYELVDLIAERYLDGAVVGGTSAGAAVMSETMISGSPDPGPLKSGGMTAHRGLGLWPQVIVDQHFLERERQGRLLTAVLDHPDKVGVGIDERTAVHVEGDGFSVLGEGSVVIYDAREAEIEDVEEEAPQSALGVALHVLRPGQRWSWDD